MKLFSVLVFFKASEDQGGKVRLLKSASDLSSFGYFQRSSVLEFLKFTARILAERNSPGTRCSVKEQDYMAHVFVRDDNLCGVIFSDQEYPKRVAHTLLGKVLDEFSRTVPRSDWWGAVEEAAKYKELPIYLSKYQNPKEADALTKLQMDLDETKIVLHGTLEAVLKRGENLDSLVSKSEFLSLQSKTYYTTAKKTNACCTYM